VPIDFIDHQTVNKMMKQLLRPRFVVPAGIVVAAAIALAAMTMHSTPSTITWERDYDRALQRAVAEKKLIIADMFTDWCVLCKKMDAETFADKELIRNMADKYVWLKLNTETEDAGIRLANEFAILTYPTIMILDSGGEEIDRVGAFQAAPQFQRTVQSFFNSPDSMASLRKAVQEQPNSIAARYALADKLLNQTNFIKAAVHFKKVVEIDPDNKEGKTDLSQYNYALCLASQMKFEEALAQLDHLKNKFPKSSTVPDAMVLRGQIYHCCNKLDEAQAALQEYKDKYPTQGHIEEVENLLAVMEAQSDGK
jgi:tetratricopeptide (TPR) repeat protein